MGIVIRQSFFNTLGSYFGVVVGAVNTIILLPRVFEDDPSFLGLINLFLAIVVIASSFITLGLPNSIVTFFPRYNPKGRAQLFSFSLLLVTLALIVSLTFGILGKDYFTGMLGDSESRELFGKYFYFLLPMILVTVYFDIIAGMLQAQMKIVFPQFMRDPFRRLIMAGGALLILFHVIPKEIFLYVLVGGYLLQFLIIILYARTWIPGFVEGFSQINTRELYNYGFFVMLTLSANIIITKVDVAMISSLKGLEEVAYYNIAFFIGSVVNIPSRSLAMSLRPMIARAWAKGNTREVEEIYKKSSVNQLLISGGFFLFIWANLDWIFLILPENYREGYWVVFYTGLAFTFTGAMGVNTMILMVTDKFRYTFYFSILMITCGIVLNFILIPRLGIEGAAIATLIAMGINNILRAWVLKKHYKILPFTPASYKLFYILASVVLVFVILKHLEIPYWIYLFTFNLSNIVLLYYMIVKMRASDEIYKIYLKLKSKILPSHLKR